MRASLEILRSQIAQAVAEGLPSWLADVARATLGELDRLRAAPAGAEAELAAHARAETVVAIVSELRDHSPRRADLLSLRRRDHASSAAPRVRRPPPRPVGSRRRARAI